METKINTENALKQALERRQTGSGLPSNFSFRMMDHIRLEAEKKRKRKARMGAIALIASVCVLVGLSIYFLVFYMELDWAGYLPQINVEHDSSLFKFYTAIAILALGLLGVDYWLRKKYIWK